MAAVALDEEIPEPEDNTRPAYETIEKVSRMFWLRISQIHADHALPVPLQRIGHLIRDLRKQIPQDQIDPTRVQPSNRKRVVKAEQAPIDLDAVNEFVAEFQARGVKLKVDELKAGLRVMGLPTTGKKADLVDRIQDYVDAHDLGGNGAKESRGKASKADVMDLDDDEEDEGFLKKPTHKKAKHVLTIDDDDDE